MAATIRQEARLPVWVVKRRNTRCEQMFSAVLPTSDIRRERASGRAEGVPLHLADAGVRHGGRDLTGRAFDQRLKLTIGAQDKSLDDRGRQNPLVLADLVDVGASSERLRVQAMTRMLIQARLAGTARFHPAPFPIFCAKPDVQRGQN
jgi:hypothetical protein